MQKYWLVMKICIQDIFEYKFDFFLGTAKYAVAILLMSLLWSAVERVANEPTFTHQETVTYFFFAAILYSLSNFHPWNIESDIRLGGLSKYLVKPIHIRLHYFSYQLGSVLVETILKALIFVPVLHLIGFPLPLPSIASLSLFIMFLPLIFICSFLILTTISMLTFWLTEAYAIRWATTSIIRIQSGVLVPIAFFPQWYQNTSFFLPFQHLAFTPIQLIQQKISSSVALQSWVILLGWTIIFYFIQTAIWKKGVYEYEGTGI